MKNERDTENIVRDHFKKYSDDIILEEQSSKNLKIQKLLNTASKSGNGKGFPEFIIQYKNNSDLLIVVECKFDILKHQSETKKEAKDYAVDGVLLYSSYLAKDYDVISIAVSGADIKELKVSHFLQMKGEKNSVEIFSNKLLLAKDYLEGYIKSPEKFRQDFNNLLDFSKKLNDNLHLHKVKESDRALLLSCVLIALENKSFEDGYKTYTNPKQLSEFLLTTVRNEFENGKIGEKKLAILDQKFSFIKTDTSLSNKHNVLLEIITDINENIKDFIKNHKYLDVLGQLYVEFLRYANSDKGLGIVLTPPHITEFMTEIVEVNKDSIVYDNCTGTGGFLVSSMNLMIKDAKGDKEKEKEIKTKQLIGVEYQADIFALACSNMFIHQDGKTNIFHGSCFDEKIIKQVKNSKPTVGLLNPPYKSDKKNDIDEFEFILNNLDCLEQGGKCVAIVPMQSALAQTGKVYEWKEKVLEKHTLEAVFSMPDELFFNSKVNVVSCIMVFTAKRPHPAEKKTYFGYYKNDGFVKRKNKGRIDLFENFKNKIKKEWIVNFQNHENIAGLSVNKVVKANDEWCAEAYMETDYSNISKEDFEKDVRNYLAFEIANNIFINKNILKSSISKNENIKLNIKNWKNFNLIDLFEITGSKTTSILDLEEYGKGEYPFITTQATNNGVRGFYDFFTEEGNILTIDSAVIGYCSFQEKRFSASDHVEKLIPKFELNKYIGLFLTTILNMEQYRYNYGIKASQTRLKERIIKLPSKNEKPDWEFMENYIKSLSYSSNL
ncbi:methyltransferase [Candidatus Kuenenbacteria bacterium HGW-Kuenenbacteria-1]|uniref:site-specific DNA-methyltransferase (adenine-specific) n=1 Tax=Candidatus Kuenenbacteria bacterium HGW-Kuenenbacteria-1 TaxID=2013812 RepID=A0A2N1UNY8_9BACT|nr:MAG: methyltransferase [Candidatus Kuenenbacteria bacterium HGW-Kuenenbacteria-1]